MLSFYLPLSTMCCMVVPLDNAAAMNQTLQPLFSTANASVVSSVFAGRTLYMLQASMCMSNAPTSLGRYNQLGMILSCDR